VREAFAQHLATSGLIEPGQTTVVGYSGGADSTCLLHLLNVLGYDVIAAHLHHGQRPEADDEALRAEEFCNSLDIPFMLGRADVPGLTKDRGMGTEEAGRHARYTFFDQARFRSQADLVATAHTEDDLIETVLLNLARGTGLTGLCGIPAQRGPIVRPLLPFRRDQTRAYCEEHGFWFHDDPSNADLNLSRAQIRHRVVPAMEAVHDGFRAATVRLAGFVQEEDGYLNGLAGSALSQIEVPLNGELAFLTTDCEFAVRRSGLLGLPLVLFRRALRLGAEYFGDALSAAHVAQLLDGLSGGQDGSLTAEGGHLVIEWKGDLVHFRRLIVDTPFRFQITFPGETIADSFGWKLTAESAMGEDPMRPAGSLDIILDHQTIQGNLYFRTAEPGDRMTPLGMNGTKKLSDLLSESGLTLAARKRLPIICDMVGPIWVPGCALGDRVKVTEHTQRPIRLTFGPLSD